MMSTYANSPSHDVPNIPKRLTLSRVFFFFGAATEEDELVKLKTLVFPGQSLPSQSPETELILEGDDDSAGLLQEKETDGLGGESRFPIGRSCCVSAHDETRRAEW